MSFKGLPTIILLTPSCQLFISAISCRQRKIFKFFARPDKGAAEAMKYHLDQVKGGVIKLFDDGTIDFFGGASFSR
jgi:hypothetical protein